MDFQPNLWLRPSDHLSLKDNEIHIWRADLNQKLLYVEMLFNTLIPDERQRAVNYYFEKDRQRFIVARGILRKILGKYLNIPSAQIRFSSNRYGKPDLDVGTDDNWLCFNVSYSRELALYAVTRRQEVGLDVEFIDEKSANLEIAERFFSPTEVSNLKTLPVHLQTAAFFSCWTRKEAYIKAVGKGLSHSLQQFTVSVIPEELFPLLSTADNFQEPGHWSLITLSPDPNYAAALAVEGSIRTIQQWQW